MRYIDYKKEDFIKDEYFQKWVLNPDEMTINFWNNWLSAHPDKKQVIQKASYAIQLLHKNEKELPKKDFDEMWQFIVQKREVPNDNYKISFFKKLSNNFQKVAAILVIGIVFSYSIYYSGIFNNLKDIPEITEPRITLEMQDGTIKYLDEVSTEVLTDKKGQTIIKKTQASLSYSSNSSKNTETLVYNELAVPYGKKFELILSDGSHVFLNSGTKLRYPINFIKDKPRDVFLDGEAYFIVAKDNSRAFTVITDDMNTRVYGTEFNVSSYKDENNTSTVLVEGSVGVYKSNNDKGDTPIIIKPGKRAVLENGIIEVNKVSVNKYISWKEGKLIFINDRFDVIVKELERHFNVSITNNFPELNRKVFTGTFSKESLDQILNVFKEHSGFNYTINKNQVTISP